MPQRYPNNIDLQELFVTPGVQVNYIEEIQKRLSFLKYLYVNSQEMLQPRHVSALWECLVANALNELERDIFFNWFSEVLTSHMKILDDSSVQMVFTEYLIRLDFVNLSESAYNCFQKYFLHINSDFGLLSTSGGVYSEVTFEVYD